MDTDKIKKASPRDKQIFLYVLGGIAFTIVLIFVFFRYEDFANIIGMVSNAIMPFLAGLVVAFILNVIVNLFEKVIFAPINLRCENGKIWNKIRRPLTLVISYLVVLSVISGIVFFIIPEVIKSGELFVEAASKNLPGYVEGFFKWLNTVAIKFNLEIDVNAIQTMITNNFNWGVIFENITKMTTDILLSVMAATFNVASGIFTLIMSIIYSAYFLSGKEKLILNFKKILYAFVPKKVANRCSMFLSLSNNVFSAYVRGQFTECVILGVLCYIGMSIIGLEYALLISSLLTICALIPMVGIFIGAALGVFILLMVKPLDAVWFIIFLICLQQFEGNVIYPRVVGSSIGLPGIWTLTAVMVFGSLFGIPGIIIGTPTTAVIYRLIKSNTYKRLNKKGIDDEILDGSEVMTLYGEILEPKPTDDGENEELEEKNKLQDFSANLWQKITNKNKSKH